MSCKDLQQFLKSDPFKLCWTNGKISDKYPLLWVNKFQEQFILYAPERLTCLDNHYDSHCPMQIFHAPHHLQSSLFLAAVQCSSAQFTFVASSSQNIAFWLYITILISEIFAPQLTLDMEYQFFSIFPWETFCHPSS